LEESWNSGPTRIFGVLRENHYKIPPFGFPMAPSLNTIIY